MNRRILLLTASLLVAMTALFSCGDDDDNNDNGNGNNNKENQKDDKKDDKNQPSQCADCVISDFATINPPAIGKIDDEAGTIVCTVTQGSVASNLSNVKPVVEVPDGYTVEPNSMVPQDFSNGKSVTYTVTNGECTKSYEVSFEKSISNGDEPCECDRYRYGIKQGFVTYVDHADGDKEIYYIFDNYGRKEHIYTADDCGWAGAIYDEEAQSIYQYGHGEENGDKCAFVSESYPWENGYNTYFNYSEQIKTLLSTGKMTGAEAVTETILGKACDGVEMQSLKILQYKCLMLYVSGDGKSMEAVKFSETLPDNPFSAKK